MERFGSSKVRGFLDLSFETSEFQEFFSFHLNLNRESGSDVQRAVRRTSNMFVSRSLLRT